MNHNFTICKIAGPKVISLWGRGRESLPHGTTAFTLKSTRQVCKYFLVHPFVPGLTEGIYDDDK